MPATALTLVRSARLTAGSADAAARLMSESAHVLRTSLKSLWLRHGDFSGMLMSCWYAVSQSSGVHVRFASATIAWSVSGGVLVGPGCGGAPAFAAGTRTA